MIGAFFVVVALLITTFDAVKIPTQENEPDPMAKAREAKKVKAEKEQAEKLAKEVIDEINKTEEKETDGSK